MKYTENNTNIGHKADHSIHFPPLGKKIDQSTRQ